MKSQLIQKYRYSTILLKELVITEFKLRYQGSALGYLWSLMRPLFLFIIMYIVFVFFLKIGSDVPNWPIQLLLGIVLWNFFADITNNGITSIVNRGDVIRKINFPKYVIVLASSISALINLFINLVVILVFMIFSGVEPHLIMLLSPVYILELFIFGIGLAFLLSSIFVKFRDINYIWEIIMQGLFYASIVIYPITLILKHGDTYAQLLLLNPVAQAIQDMRHVLVSPDAHTLFSLTGGNWGLVLIPVVITFTFLIIGARFFKKSSPKFAEEV